MAFASTVARRGAVDDRQVGPPPDRLPRRSPRGRGVRQALPGARLPGHVPPVVPPGQGTERGQAIRGLASIGVHTISPIALGERRKRNFLFENYLITREIPGTVPLDEFLETRLDDLPEPRRSRVRQRLATSLAVLTARLHDAGIVAHRLPSRQRPGPARRRRPAAARHDRPRRPAGQPAADLGGGPAEPGPAEPLLLAAEQPDRPVPLPERPTSRTGAGSRPTRGRFAQEIEDATRAWAERLWRRWGRRCRGTQQVFPDASERRLPGPSPAATSTRRGRDPAGRPRRALRRPGPSSSRTRGRRRSPRRRMPVGGRPTRGHLQAVQPQEMDRSAPHPVPPFARLAVLAGRASTWPAEGSRPRRTWLSSPDRWPFRPVRCLVPPPRDLPGHAQAGARRPPSPTTSASRSPRSSPTIAATQVRKLNLALARLIRVAPRSVALASRPEGVEHPDPSTRGRRRPRLLSLIDLVGRPAPQSGPRGRRIQNLARLSISLASVPGRTRTEALRFLRAYLPWGSRRSRLEARLAATDSGASRRSRRAESPARTSLFPDPESLRARG